MEYLRHFGRILFAIGIAAFGVQYLLCGHYLGGLPPVPPWAPGATIGAYVVGIFLIVSALSIATGWKAHLSATLLGAFFFLCVLLLHLQHFSDVLNKGNERTRALEPLALAAVAFALAGAFPHDSAKSSAWDSISRIAIKYSGCVFAFTLIVFGVQHFLYAAYLPSFVPAWIPAHVFLIYFTGVCFIASGLSIAFRILAPLAASLLGLMFFLWVLVLHAPRVFASLHNGDEWSSLFVALAMAGGSFFFATILSKRR